MRAPQLQNGRRRAVVALSVGVVLASILVMPAATAVPAPGATQRLSQGPGASDQWQGNSTDPAVTPDGHYIAMLTQAKLDPLDTSPAAQANVYVKDSVTGRTSLVTLANALPRDAMDPSGTSQTVFNQSSSSVSISADGRYVAVQTAATGVNAEQPYAGGSQDVFVCDRDTDNNGVYDEVLTGVNKRETYCTFVGDRNAAVHGGNRTVLPRISADGSSVSWLNSSPADSLGEMFVTRLDRDPDGRVLPPPDTSFVHVPQAPNAFVRDPVVLTTGGDYAVYSSYEDEGFTPRRAKLYGYDFATGRIDRLDVDASGAPYGTDGSSVAAAVSADGRRVAFERVPVATAEDHAVVVVDRDPDGNGQFAPGVAGEPISSVVESRRSDGSAGNGHTPALSSDGRYLAFVTKAAGMYDGTDNTNPGSCAIDLGPQSASSCQIVVRDVVLDEQRQSAGQQPLSAALATQSVGCADPNGCGAFLSSFAPVLTGNGSAVIFESDADDLIAGDTNNARDIYQRRFTPTLTSPGVDFGTVDTGQPSVMTVIAKQSGFGTLPVGAVSITGPNADEFTLTGTQTCTGTILHQTEQCLVAVQFLPTAAGTRTASLVINAPDGRQLADIPLIGNDVTATPSTGTTPPASPGRLEVASASTAFGERPQFSTSPQQSVVLINKGGSALTPGKSTLSPTLSGVVVFPGDYTVVTDGCANTPLAPSATCVIQIAHSPKGVGPRNGLLEVTDDSGGNQIVPLTGSGAPTTLAVSPSVSRVGRVLRVTGAGFPPSSTVRIGLPGAGPTAVATTDATGKFSTPFILMAEASLGVQALQAQSTSTPVKATTNIVVSRGSAQPPSFTSH